MDLGSQVAQAVNAWLAAATAQLIAPALEAAGQLVFATPAFHRIPAVGDAWALVRGLADLLFVLAWLAAGVLIMAGGDADTRYSVKRQVPRLALAGILANASLGICGTLIDLDNALVAAVLGPTPAATVVSRLGALLVGQPLVGDLVAVCVDVTAAALALLLVALFIGRDLVLVLAVVLAPLALATHALPQTEELAQLWWRVFSALLFVQVIEALLIAVGTQLLAATDWLGVGGSALVSGLLVVTLLYVLFKLPFAAYRWAFRAPIGRSVVARTFGVATRAVGWA